MATALTPELEKKAREELQETPENKEKAIKYLNHLILSETSLHFPRNDPEFLFRFLRWSKWDYKKAFDRLVKYYKSRLSYAADFELGKPSNLANFYKERIQIILPQCDKQGRRIIFLNQENWNPDTVSNDEAIRSGMMIVERLVSEVATQINGIVILANANNTTAKQVTHSSAFHYMKYIDFVVSSIPLRVKEIHIVTNSSIFQTINAIVCAALPAKIKERYTVYKDFEALHTKFDKNFLPSELGGNLQKLDYEEFAREMVEWEENVWNKTSKYGNPAM